MSYIILRSRRFSKAVRRFFQSGHQVAKVFRSGHSLLERKGSHSDIVMRLRKLQLKVTQLLLYVKDHLVHVLSIAQGSHRELGTYYMDTSLIVHVAALLDDLSATESCGMTLNVIDGFRWQIEMIYRELLAKEVSGELQTFEEAILPFVSEAYGHSVRAVEVLEADNCGFLSGLVVPLVCSGRVGRPSFYIPQCVIAHLLRNRLSVPKIAESLDVSISTVRRHMVQFGLSVQETYADLSDSEVSEIVSNVNLKFPTWGVPKSQEVFCSRTTVSLAYRRQP